MSEQIKPSFSDSEVLQIAQSLYGVTGTLKPLPGELDQNFRLTTADQSYVLKLSDASGRLARSVMEGQNAGMLHLQAQLGADNHCPVLRPTLAGEQIGRVTNADGQLFLVRLVTWLEGRPMGTVHYQTPALHEHFGRVLGQMDVALASFDHPALHFYLEWDIAASLDIVREYSHHIAEPELRSMVEHIADRYERDTLPLLPDCPQSIIHSDANEYNVLVGGGDSLYTNHQAITGVIDFGDMIYSYTVAEIAIAIAYAVLDKANPLETACAMVKGYHAIRPLNDAEFAVIYPMMFMRLCVSASFMAYQRKLQPDNDHLLISQAPLRRTLPTLVKTHPRLATMLFRAACGLNPSLHSTDVVDWLKQQTFAPVLGIDLALAPSIVLDLSPSGYLVAGDPAQNAEPPLTARIFSAMQAAQVPVSIGRYDEPRLIYTAPFFATGDGITDERRTIHVGLDLFAPAGTTVFAPLDGTVFRASFNPDPLDYGGVIILQHETDDGAPFFTLYGHLSADSLAHIYEGQTFRKGEPFATFGAPIENGNWPPHLHLQIITDLLELDTDFPGVILPSQRAVWTALSPDPNILVGVPKERFPAADIPKAETLQVRKAKVGRNLSIGYRKPLKMVRGWMQYLYDERGQKHLDAYNNVPHVGHCHPHVVAAGQRQMSILNTNTRYLHDSLNHYAERLSATMPDPLSVCFFVNSASEANELALRLARAYTGQRDMIVNEGAYHGHTTSLIDISPYKHDGPGGSGAPDWVHTAPVADVYRGAYKARDPDAAIKYAAHIQTIIEELAERGRSIAGFIAETCPSVGGQIMLPDNYLVASYGFVKAAGGLTIADEVQTGYGRIGTHMYAFQAHNVVPDIVVLGKPIGNGHPIGAVITTPEIAEAFNNGMEFFSTFGGNTVSCAVGLAVLDVMEQSNLMAHAKTVGDIMLDGMRDMMTRHDIIGDVRGSGLFLGMELVHDRETLAPAAAEASFVSNRMREHGILLGTDGPLHNVVKIRPPMPFNAADATFLLETLESCLNLD